jgi:hypothetical protein
MLLEQLISSRQCSAGTGIYQSLREPYARIELAMV